MAMFELFSSHSLPDDSHVVLNHLAASAFVYLDAILYVTFSPKIWNLSEHNNKIYAFKARAKNKMQVQDVVTNS